MPAHACFTPLPLNPAPLPPPHSTPPPQSGAISFRFPAFKHQPLQLLAADLDRGVLVTVSRNVIKIWNMADVRCMHELQTSRPVRPGAMGGPEGRGGKERTGVPAADAMASPLPNRLLGQRTALVCVMEDLQARHPPIAPVIPFYVIPSKRSLNHPPAIHHYHSSAHFLNLHSLHLPPTPQVSRLELLEGRAIAGTVTGSVHVAELHSGAANAASVTADHLDAVTGLATSVHLQHMVTGSRDSHIKVRGRAATHVWTRGHVTESSRWGDMSESHWGRGAGLARRDLSRPRRVTPFRVSFHVVIGFAYPHTPPYTSRAVPHTHTPQVFDRDKRFKRSIYLGAPVSAVAYLNDAGDILVAMGQRLVVVRAAQYDNLAGGKVRTGGFLVCGSG